MDTPIVEQLVRDLLIVLSAGLLSGLACKRLGVSMLVGYLVVGGLIGQGGLGLVSQHSHELEYLARTGALLLLFAIGIEFSIDELARLSRFALLGGLVQMLLVAAPTTAVYLWFAVPLGPAVLFGAAIAFSSTVLVFRALAEWGQTTTPHGRRAIAILLFQDVALVPLMLVVPLLTGTGEKSPLVAGAVLAVKSLAFVLAVPLLRTLTVRWAAPVLAKMRSTELVVLFALTVLSGASLAAYSAGLPPALGAFAAGLILSGNRLTKQIDALVLPYRETFAAVFFISLGTLLRPHLFLEEPLLLTVAFVVILLLKSLTAAVALRLVGLSWRAALGMGVGLAQLGEFAFVLLSEGLLAGVVSQADYNRVLLLALGTLVITPQLLKWGLGLAMHAAVGHLDQEEQIQLLPGATRRAIVVGLGMIGRNIASALEATGLDVCCVDLSSVNLHPFAQAGFRTTAGDASDPDVWQHADLAHSSLVVVTVPNDGDGLQIAKTVRGLNPRVPLLVRCRYQGSQSALKRAGADTVVSEEAKTSATMVELCQQIVHEAQAKDDA